MEGGENGYQQSQGLVQSELVPPHGMQLQVCPHLLILEVPPSHPVQLSHLFQIHIRKLKMWMVDRGVSIN